MVLNLAIIIYIENQSVFFKRGIRAQMGHMAQWIELVSEHKQSNVDDLSALPKKDRRKR